MNLRRGDGSAVSGRSARPGLPLQSSAVTALAGAWLLAGCGGELPLLHPAQTLPAGDVRAFAGASGTFAVGGFSSAIRNATSEGAPAAGAANPVEGPSTQVALGAVALAATAPGVAPIAGARVGLGAEFEGGLAYTGRAVRADLRRAFALSDTWAISVGAAGSATFYGRTDDSTAVLPAVDLGRLHGWGVDAPVLLGYASAGDLYMLWVGARVGWEHVDDDDAADIGNSPPLALSATRFWGGGLLGLAAGFRHIHVALELDVSYASVTGDYGPAHVRVDGLTLAPASAIWWRF